MLDSIDSPLCCIFPLGVFLILSVLYILKGPDPASDPSPLTIDAEEPPGTPAIISPLSQPVLDQPLLNLDVDAFTTHAYSPNPGSKVRLTKEMRKQAKVDYNTARGTIHLQLLRTAQTTLKSRVEEIERQLLSHKLALASSDQRRDDELLQTLVRHLVETELATLPGIGPRLASAVKKQVFRGNLSDLRNASLVDGIGPRKQITINDWLTNAERRLPGLLAAGFPRKQEINGRYEAERKRLTREIAADEASLRQQADILVLVNEEIARLSVVSVREFELVLADPATGADKVNRHLLGSFAPWEPMPEWFAQALEVSGQQSIH